MGRRRPLNSTSRACAAIFVMVCSLLSGQGFMCNGFCLRNGIGNMFLSSRRGPSSASNVGKIPTPSSLGSHEDGHVGALRKTDVPPALNVPVFSQATLNEDESTNMNVVTYASPAGIQPDRLWMISLYKSTLSYGNFVREGWGVLQFLRPEHSALATLLGKQSGRDVDKDRESEQLSFPWETPSAQELSAPKGIAVIPGCMASVTLEVVNSQPAGDHDAFVCRVIGVAKSKKDEGSSDSNAEWLTTRYLRELGII